MPSRAASRDCWSVSRAEWTGVGRQAGHVAGRGLVEARVERADEHGLPSAPRRRAVSCPHALAGAG